MGCGKKLVESFLDKVPDEKLEHLPEFEHTIYLDWAIGYRLDHQGLNDDEREGDWTHRLFIQPIGSKSKSQRIKSNKNTKAIVARCHSKGDATANQLKKALLDSYRCRAVLKHVPEKK